ncbi:hypothetical protein ACFL6X_03770 [Candidatus Latescibacterota bacterium]
MRPITMDQWLELHKRTLDCVRGALEGLTQEQLLWEQPMLAGQTGEPSCGEPRPCSLAGLAWHILCAERYWLREVGIQPAFDVPERNEWTLAIFEQALSGVEEQYERVLSERSNDPDVLFGLGRVCQHNLSHWKMMEHLRMLQDPDWRQPSELSWERAADYMTDLMILGARAPLAAPGSHADVE